MITNQTSPPSSVELVRRLNRWRRGDESLTMESPKAIGEALDAVCDTLDEHANEIQGWQNKWKCAVEMAAQAECKLDEAITMHAYANEQRKAAGNARMNAEETVARLRAKVDDLLKHGKDACEYTDGWEDALLIVRDAFPPENDNVEGPAA